MMQLQRDSCHVVVVVVYCNNASGSHLQLLPLPLGLPYLTILQIHINFEIHQGLIQDFNLRGNMNLSSHAVTAVIFGLYDALYIYVIVSQPPFPAYCFSSTQLFLSPILYESSQLVTLMLCYMSYVFLFPYGLCNSIEIGIRNFLIC